jgi:glucosamine-6-phosphate deaminase
MNIKVFNIAAQAAEFVAEEIIELVQQKPNCNLGLATGRTMNAIYFHLVKKALDQNIDFSRVHAFVLDEYIGLKKTSKNSFLSYLNLHLFDHLNFKQENIFLPDVHSTDIDLACFEYEELIRSKGGVDLQLLGIGLNGHIGLNEPGSSYDSRTRIVALTSKTVQANKELFKDESIPLTAVSMGIGTILESKKCILVATGETKSEIIQKMVNGDINSKIPATFLKEHKKHLIVLDHYAAKLI